MTHSFSITKTTGMMVSKNGGKEVSVVERPLLTREPKERRVQWVQRWYDILSDPSAAVAFLDKKWFYISNQRRKVKKMPTDVTEVGPINAHRKPRVQSRRFRTKVMFMGVVACPQPRYNFDGRVYLSRVSRTKRLARSSRNKRFSVDVDVVNAIVSGVWKRQLVTDGMTVEHLLEELKTYYDLDEYVSDRLVMGYATYTRGGNKMWKFLDSDDLIDEMGMRTNEEGTQVAVTIDDVELFVQQEAGDEVEEDITCDSNFMMEKIPEIGRALREIFLDSTRTSHLPIHGQRGRARHR